MVSNASDDLPDPDTPVITVSFSWGIESEMFLRLWTRAPWIRIKSSTGDSIIRLRSRGVIEVKPPASGRGQLKHAPPMQVNDLWWRRRFRLRARNVFTTCAQKCIVDVYTREATHGWHGEKGRRSTW